MRDWGHCPAVERDPARVSGAWLFKGTRVPVKALFENLEGGASVDDFLSWFPGVTREQIEAVLQHADRVALDRALAESQEDVENGRLIDAEEVLRALRQP
jgi:uncharacterized protein (DUF433 family)